MKKLQHLLVSMLCLSPFAPAFADRGTMTATTTDGKTVTIDLVDQMQACVWTLNEADSPLMLAVYTGAVKNDGTGRLVPTEAEGREPGKIWFEMPIADLSEIKFTGLASVKEIPVGEGISVNVADGTLSVSGIKTPVEVAVYSLSGIREDKMTLTQDAVIDLGRYGSGMHLVNVGSATFKIMTK